MKKTLLLFTAIVFVINFSNAQTTAQDWIKTDCNGISHQLFTELDNGNCVILAFDMLPSCGLCINAANLMEPIVNTYRTNYPGRIKFYCLGYINSYTCSDIQSWETANSFDHDAVFTNGAADVAYYGGMGMPTIVVLGRNSHHVWWDKKGISSSDMTAFQNAMDSALYISTGVSSLPSSENNVEVFPNPSNGKTTLSFSLENNSDVTVKVVSVLGQVMKSFSTQQFNSGNNKMEINTAELPVGTYFITLKTNDSVHTVKMTVAE